MPVAVCWSMVPEETPPAIGSPPMMFWRSPLIKLLRAGS